MSGGNNPLRRMFEQHVNLPGELSRRLDMDRDVMGSIKVSPWEVMRTWYQERKPSVTHQQDCVDAISGNPPDSNREDEKELFMGGKLAFLAYAMPYFMPLAGGRFHMRNDAFVQYMQSYVGQATLAAYKHMNAILDGQVNFLLMPDHTNVSGFYIRTPIQVWNQAGQRVYRIPSWTRRQNLLHNVVVGNVNVYVLRQNLKPHEGFELYVCLRGTSNEFNGIPQYGRKLNNTQVFRVPKYDIQTGKFHMNGSNTTPLYYYYYALQLEQVWPELCQCLLWLGVEDPECRRIVVAGHSMGGALTITLCAILRHRRRAWWDKTFFRAFASPLCCNEAAIVTTEQWCIDSRQKNKFIECVNRDDFVNLQFLLGGVQGVRSALRRGTTTVTNWVLQHYTTKHRPKSGSGSMNQEEQTRKENMMSHMLRIAQRNPEVALSAFLQGALSSQTETLSDTKEAGFRMGQRAAEMKLWGSRELNDTYNGTLRLFFCKRRIADWSTEYVGKAHSNYVDVNFSALWAALREYEDNLYRWYHKHGLRKRNRLRVVGLFPETDQKEVRQLLRTYKPRPAFTINRRMIRHILRLQNRKMSKEEDPLYFAISNQGRVKATHIHTLNTDLP